MKKCLVCLLGIAMFLWCSSAMAAPIFYDSFTRTGELVGTSPDTGTGGATYVYFPTLVPTDSTTEKVGTGSNAYLRITSDNAGGNWNNFSIRTVPTGINYAYSPTFYMTATFKSSDLSSQYGGHLGVEVGIDVKNSSGASLVRQQQIGLGQSGWYGDLAADPHTVAWGSGTSFGRHSLGDYALGSTVTLALKFEEKLMNLPTPQYMYEVFAGVVQSPGVEPTWTKIAGESNKSYTYSVDYIGLIVGGIDGGPGVPAVTHSGYIDEIRIGKTWNDVTPVPVPAAFWLLGAGIACLAGVRRRFRG
jgi:hypothetical protein